MVCLCMRKRPPIPKEGVLFDFKVVARVTLKSVGVVGLTVMKRLPLPNENLCCAVEKLIALWWTIE